MDQWLSGIGAEGWRDKQVEQRGFGGHKTIVYDALMADTHHYTSVKTHRTCNTRMNPNTNCGL